MDSKRLKIVPSIESSRKKSGRHSRDTALYQVAVYISDLSIKLVDNEASKHERNRLGFAVHDELIRSAGVRPGIRVEKMEIRPDGVSFVLAIKDCPRESQCANSRCREGKGSMCKAPHPGKIGRPPAMAVAAFVDHFKKLCTARFCRELGRIMREDDIWQLGHFEKPVREGNV